MLLQRLRGKVAILSDPELEQLYDELSEPPRGQPRGAARRAHRQ